jgi:hypothetical protein
MVIAHKFEPAFAFASASACACAYAHQSGTHITNALEKFDARYLTDKKLS